MQPSFKPPKDEAEFKARAAEITVSAAENMLGILRSRREQATKPIDAEILFYKKVLDSKKESA